MSHERFSKKTGFIDGKHSSEKNHLRRVKFGDILSFRETAVDELSWRRSDATYSTGSPQADSATTSYSNPCSAISSPSHDAAAMSPWTQHSPYVKSPWIYQSGNSGDEMSNGLIGSLLREEGHVYSLATDGDLLYTGSESKNIRVWKNFEEYSVFKSGSGLVKAIVLFDEKVFTGHQDGKIRIWKLSGEKKKTHKRVGNFPTSRDLMKTAINPKNYVSVRRKQSVPWIKHHDAVSCLTIDADLGLLYSGSWDKTWKVWKISNSECLESISGHDDAVNSILVEFGLIFTGAADGTVKAWRRELVGKSTQHLLVETLLRQDHAVTSMAATRRAGALFAGSSDGLVSFWDRRKHFMAFGGVLRGHKQAVLCLACAGHLVISGSADKTICVWRRDTSAAGRGVYGYACVSVLKGHMGPVKCLAVRESGEEESWIIYSGSLDRSVKVWRISDGFRRGETERLGRRPMKTLRPKTGATEKWFGSHEYHDRYFT